MILVIGSRGTVGTALVRQLRANGHEVFEADLQHCEEKDYMRCDVGIYRQVEALLNTKQFELVYMLAAEFGRHNGELYYEQCWTTNVIGGRHVMEICAEKDIPLVFMSSSEAYGETPEALMRESDTDRFPLRHHNDYAMSKWVNEQQIMNLEREKDLKCVRIRFFNSYGPGEHYHPFRSVVCLFTYSALMGLPYTVYEGYHRVFMYIDDAARTLANIYDNFLPGSVYNIGGEEYREVRDVDEILRWNLKDRFRSDVTYLARDGHNTVNKRPDIEKAVTELDHQLTVDLESGLLRTLAWMRDTYGTNIGSDAVLQSY